MHLLLSLLALLAFGCAESAPAIDGDSDVSEVTVELTQQAFRQDVAVAEETPVCGVVFSPVPELLAETVAAAARWSAATGCDIRVGEGGIALRLVEERMTTPWGTEGHGHTYCPTEAGCTRSEVVIDVARDHDPATVVHELGHALGATAGHVEDDPTALMSHTGGKGEILACDLVFVCATLDCSVMTPEA